MRSESYRAVLATARSVSYRLSIGSTAITALSSSTFMVAPPAIPAFANTMSFPAYYGRNLDGGSEIATFILGLVWARMTPAAGWTAMVAGPPPRT